MYFDTDSITKDYGYPKPQPTPAINICRSIPYPAPSKPILSRSATSLSQTTPLMPSNLPLG